jgi:hypothetical protein
MNHSYRIRQLFRPRINYGEFRSGEDDSETIIVRFLNVGPVVPPQSGYVYKFGIIIKNGCQFSGIFHIPAVPEMG